MRPLNLDNRPCSPISSNCVIWQGPDIPCIKLCTGDTVSDIIASLGAELCTIMDQLKVSNYDLSCLNLTACPPEDFQALIQLLINKICELNGIPAGEEKAAGCPDCVVSVAPCFVEGNQTTMQLIDYVQMIANRICDILDQIDVINNQITNLDNRVTVLENTPPPTFTLPSIDTNCLADYMPIPGTTSAPIDQVLDALLSNSTNGYCSLIEATGLPADLASAVISQCIDSTDLSLKSEAEGDSPVQTMTQEYFGSWVNTPTTIGDAITNLWISLCDIRSYLDGGNPITVVVAGDWINVTSATVGTTTTYTVSSEDKPAMRAQSTPSILNRVTPGVDKDLYDGVTQLMPEIYDDDNAYNPLTGIWTCPATGIYNLSFYVHLSKVDGLTFIGFSSGMVIAGVITSAPTGFYAVDAMTVTQITRHIDITGSALGMNITSGTQLKLNILNMSDVDYDVPFPGDVARMVIQRVK